MLRLVWLVIISGLSMSVFAESLYSDADFRSLVSDHRARQVGETLTILIYEQASAATSSGTDTQRSSDFSARVNSTNMSEIAALGVGNDFAGGGKVSRSGELVASVSVTIEEIFANGEMRVKGEQLISFNDEKQFIKLAGTVRAQDISTQNTVLSTRLANAVITYKGDGILGRQQKPGMFTRLFNWIF